MPAGRSLTYSQPPSSTLLLSACAPADPEDTTGSPCPRGRQPSGRGHGINICLRALGSEESRESRAVFLGPRGSVFGTRTTSSRLRGNALHDTQCREKRQRGADQRGRRPPFAAAKKKGLTSEAAWRAGERGAEERQGHWPHSHVGAKEPNGPAARALSTQPSEGLAEGSGGQGLTWGLACIFAWSVDTDNSAGKGGGGKGPWGHL